MVWSIIANGVVYHVKNKNCIYIQQNQQFKLVSAKSFCKGCDAHMYGAPNAGNVCNCIWIAATSLTPILCLIMRHYHHHSRLMYGKTVILGSQLLQFCCSKTDLLVILCIVLYMFITAFNTLNGKSAIIPTNCRTSVPSNWLWVEMDSQHRVASPSKSGVNIDPVRACILLISGFIM